MQTVSHRAYLTMCTAHPPQNYLQDPTAHIVSVSPCKEFRVETCNTCTDLLHTLPNIYHIDIQIKKKKSFQKNLSLNFQQNRVKRTSSNHLNFYIFHFQNLEYNIVSCQNIFPSLYFSFLGHCLWGGLRKKVQPTCSDSVASSDVISDGDSG